MVGCTQDLSSFNTVKFVFQSDPTVKSKMASIAFPEIAKLHTLSTSHTYNYVYHAATASQATILLLHGFPSSCYDWRHQIHHFINLGYGVLAPDLLGYGGTSKPTAVEEYKLKSMAREIIE